MTTPGEEMKRLNYRHIFDPSIVETSKRDGETELDDASVYIFDDESLVLAINVAIASRRCLLVLGPPGSGKSSLAANVARIMNIPCYVEVITSRTQAQDFLWKTDLVRRLNDAQVGKLKDDTCYWKKGVLWYAFEIETATLSSGGSAANPLPTSCVVLLDEIDKAEAEVTDGLLVPLDQRSFVGPDDRLISSGDGHPLIIITSNNERDLSNAFIRRCVVVTLRPPSENHLIEVANAKLGHDNRRLHEAVATLFLKARDLAEATSGHTPHTAEFLDAVRACREMEIVPGSQEWASVEQLVLAKEQK